MILDPLRRWEQCIGALPMPSPLVWIALIAAFLGFGVLMGRATGPDSLGALAAKRAPLRLLIASTPIPATTGSSTSAPPLPLPEAEKTPEPAAGSEGSKQTSGGNASASKGSQASTGSGASYHSTSTSSESSTGSGEKSSAGGEGSSPSPSAKLPAIKHVFVLMLSEQPYASMFGPASAAHYLSGTLEKQGELIVRYYAVAHEQLANAVALISGQGPTPETAANCPTYTDIVPASVGAEEQVGGHGCVYPSTTQTLAGQLAAKHLSWRAYIQGMDEATTHTGACEHPTLGQSAPTAASPPPAGAYATFRNPFVYFHALTDTPACVANDVGLNKLSSELTSAKGAPSFSYIVPDRCHDANPTPCAPGAPAGPAAADSFLKQVVPQITASKAYKSGGLLVITVDEAPSTGEFADSSSCCGQPRFPNLAASEASAVTGLAPNGGGQVGALLLSPFVKPGSTSQEPFNHFSLLRTIEDLFGLKHLGYAGSSHVSSFEPSMFSAAKGG